MDALNIASREQGKPGKFPWLVFGLLAIFRASTVALIAFRPSRPCGAMDLDGSHPRGQVEAEATRSFFFFCGAPKKGHPLHLGVSFFEGICVCVCVVSKGAKEGNPPFSGSPTKRHTHVLNMSRF